MKVVGIIQARTGSTRLPGKVLLEVAGRPLLQHVIDRVLAARLIHEVIIATTTKQADDAISILAKQAGVGVFRGSEDDVLERYYHAAQACGADVVVRVTSDCPLLDPQTLDQVILRFLDAQRSPPRPDYVSNNLERSFPLGLDAEAFSFLTLARAHKEARTPYEREHVTPYICEGEAGFRLLNLRHPWDLSFHRWTVDTAEDLALVREIYRHLYRDGYIFRMYEVLRLFLDRPELFDINRGAHREAG